MYIGLIVVGSLDYLDAHMYFFLFFSFDISVISVCSVVESFRSNQ